MTLQVKFTEAIFGSWFLEGKEREEKIIRVLPLFGSFKKKEKMVLRTLINSPNPSLASFFYAPNSGFFWRKYQFTNLPITNSNIYHFLPFSSHDRWLTPSPGNSPIIVTQLPFPLSFCFIFVKTAYKRRLKRNHS